MMTKLTILKSILEQMLKDEINQFYIDQTKETDRIFYTKNSTDIPLIPPMHNSLESALIRVIKEYSRCNQDNLGAFTIFNSSNGYTYRANVEVVNIKGKEQVAMRLVPTKYRMGNTFYL